MARQIDSPQGGAQPPVPHKLPAGLINRTAAWKRSRDIRCLTIEVRIAEHILMHHLNLFQLFRCQPSAVLTRFLKHDKATAEMLSRNGQSRLLAVHTYQDTLQNLQAAEQIFCGIMNPW